MNHLFWGLFFCLLDFEITVGTAVFGLLPDALGYYLLMKGMTHLAGEDAAFDRGRHWAFGLLIVGVIQYGADLLNPDSMTKVAFWVLELGTMMVMMLLLRIIISGIAHMERENGWQLGSEGLKTAWLILVIMQPLCHLLSWIPFVGSICTVASAVVGALFLLFFWKSRKQFYGNL